MSGRWGGALRHAATVFGIAPEAFWRLSVVEWRALTGGGVVPLRVDEFAALRAAFPDEGAASSSRHGRA